jgi:hypothetical protein
MIGQTITALKNSDADGRAVVAKMKEMPTDDPLFGQGTIPADGRKTFRSAGLFRLAASGLPRPGAGPSRA